MERIKKLREEITSLMNLKGSVSESEWKLISKKIESKFEEKFAIYKKIEEPKVQQEELQKIKSRRLEIDKIINLYQQYMDATSSIHFTVAVFKVHGYEIKLKEKLKIGCEKFPTKIEEIKNESYKLSFRERELEQLLVLV